LDEAMRRSIPVALAALALTLSLLSTGCTPPVPPQAAELSRAVGDRIAATQASHEAFLMEYFESSRARVEDFLQQRWIPEFLANFTADAELMELLSDSTLVGQRGDEERGAIVMDFATAAIKEIEAQRRSLLRPIDRLEREALKELRANYADLNAMNASVTSYIESVQKLSEARDAILYRLDLLEARDQAVRDAAALNDEISRILEGADEAEGIYRRLQDLVDEFGPRPQED
jgi:hypothetical protein